MKHRYPTETYQKSKDNEPHLITQEQLDSFQALVKKKKYLIDACSAPQSLVAWTITYFVILSAIDGMYYQCKIGAGKFAEHLVVKYGGDAKKVTDIILSKENRNILAKEVEAYDESHLFFLMAYHLTNMIIPFTKPVF